MTYCPKWRAFVAFDSLVFRKLVIPGMPLGSRHLLRDPFRGGRAMLRVYLVACCAVFAIAVVLLPQVTSAQDSTVENPFGGLPGGEGAVDLVPIPAEATPGAAPGVDPGPAGEMGLPVIAAAP